MRYLTFPLIVVAALLLFACGGEEAAPVPTPAPAPAPAPAIDEAALSRLVQQAVQAAVPEQPAQPAPVSAQEIQTMVQAAVQAAAPEGASPEQIRSMVEQAVTASAQPGVSREDIEGVVARAIGEAAAQQPGLSAEDVQKIVSDAIMAIPTAEPMVVVATPVPVVQTPGFVLRALEANPKRGGIFREAIPVSLNAFDVLQGGGIHIVAPAYNKLVQRNVMDGLRTIVPDLAESWDSTPDAMAFTLTLRTGVTYHDGTPFNADDVLANMTRIIDPPEGVTSSLKDTLAAVETVEKLDDDHVKFTLNNPTPYFLEILTAGNMVMYSDEELNANNGDLRRIEIPTGTGPFTFQDHAPDERWKLRSNPNYFVPGLPYLDGVDVVHAVTWPERGTAVLTGQADYSFNVSRGTWDEGQKRPDISVAETPCLFSHNVAFNNEKPPFDNPLVRRAIHLAVSRQIQIDGYRPVWEPTFVTRWIPVPSPYATDPGQISGMPGYRPDKEADIAAARELMAQAGFPDGFKTEIVTWNGAPTAEVATPLFVDLLKKSLNIEADIRVIERFTGGEILASGDYELDRGYSFGGPLLDPYLMWNSYFRTGGNQNWSRYSNAEFDAVLDKLAGELDPIERQQLFNQGMDILDQDPPVYHIGFCAWSPMWYNYVKGLNLNIRALGSNTDSWETTWLDK